MPCQHILARQVDELGTMVCRHCGEEVPVRQQLLRMKEVFVFVSRDPDGNECVPVWTFPDGLVIPLVCSDKARVDSLRGLAKQMAEQSGVKITLCRFYMREELEVIA